MNSYIALFLICLSFHSSATDISYNKKLHFSVSAAISSGTMLLTNDKKISMLTCLSFGVSKELYDQYTYGGFDEKDLLIDSIGCAFGTILGNKALKFTKYNNGIDSVVGIQYRFEF